MDIRSEGSKEGKFENTDEKQKKAKVVILYAIYRLIFFLELPSVFLLDTR